MEPAERWGQRPLSTPGMSFISCHSSAFWLSSICRACVPKMCLTGGANPSSECGRCTLKEPRAQFRHYASAVLNLIAFRFDCSMAETRLWFRRLARVVPNSGMLLKPSNNNNSLHEHNHQKYVSIINEFCLALQEHDIWIAAVRVELNLSTELNSKVRFRHNASAMP